MNSPRVRGGEAAEPWLSPVSRPPPPPPECVRAAGSRSAGCGGAVGCGGWRGHGEEPSRRPALQGAVPKGVTGRLKLPEAVR